MDWWQVITISVFTVGACFFMHRENLNDRNSIAQELKDFHGRLCTLEERYFQMMQKLLEKK